MSSERWKRVTRQRPCPVCGKPDWCAISSDGSAVLCQRVEDGAVRRVGEAGWLHRLGTAGGYVPSQVRTVHVSASVLPPDLTELVRRYARAVRAERLDEFATNLGVTVPSLRRLRTGWDGTAWTFPMRSAAGRIIGIRRRLRSGRKLSVKNGREGLFVPDGLGRPDVLMICEGPTDTAALLDLGFDAIGRPSCTGGTRYIVGVIQLLAPRSIVIVADADEPGQCGGNALASALAVYCRDVRIITPPQPIKDARDWKQAGATGQEIQNAIKAAPARRLSVRCRRIGA